MKRILFILSIIGLVYLSGSSSHLLAGEGKHTQSGSQKSIRVFPTRTEGDVCIDPGSTSKKAEKLQVDVYNALGQKLQSLSIHADEISNLRLQGLSKGIYLLAIRNNDEVLQVSKVIKE